jgi:hypothetical protein
VVFSDGPAAGGWRRSARPGTITARRVLRERREICLHLLNDAGRSKLTIDYFERQLGVAATALNGNTLLKLLALAQH